MEQATSGNETYGEHPALEEDPLFGEDPGDYEVNTSYPAALKAERGEVHVGERVRLLGRLRDPRPIEAGTEGTITHVNHLGDSAQYSVRWDNGRRLMLLDTDIFEVLR
jgi:hypothetical protein